MTFGDGGRARGARDAGRGPWPCWELPDQKVRLFSFFGFWRMLLQAIAYSGNDMFWSCYRHFVGCYFVGFIMAKFCRTLIMQRLVEILGLGLRSVFNIFFGHLFAGYLLRLWQSLNAQRSLVFCFYLLVYNCLWFRLEAAIG